MEKNFNNSELTAILYDLDIDVPIASLYLLIWLFSAALLLVRPTSLRGKVS